jgi:hypothetical protein
MLTGSYSIIFVIYSLSEFCLDSLPTKLCGRPNIASTPEALTAPGHDYTATDHQIGEYTRMQKFENLTVNVAEQLPR